MLLTAGNAGEKRQRTERSAAVPAATAGKRNG
jgi:hypothetical protein